MLSSTRQLNPLQLEQLSELSTLCQQHDGGLPVIYHQLLAQKRDSKNTVFYHQDEQLLGFLAIYFFYEQACEVSLLVAPNHRRQHIASQLLLKIIPLLITKEIEKLIFSIPSVIATDWLTSLGFSYSHSEYHMTRTGYAPVLLHNPLLEIRLATIDDINILSEIDNACFKDGQPNSHARFTNLLNDSNYSLFLAYYKQQPIGKAHICWQNAQILFSDIAILPTFQGQGLGNELLIFCINQTLMQGHSEMALDVEGHNITALNLYLRHDFKTAYQHDFWCITVSALQLLLQQKQI